MISFWKAKISEFFSEKKLELVFIFLLFFVVVSAKVLFANSLSAQFDRLVQNGNDQQTPICMKYVDGNIVQIPCPNQQ